MQLEIPAMIDCHTAVVTILFDNGSKHIEMIDLEDESFELVCELDYMLFQFLQHGIDDRHDADSWIELSTRGGHEAANATQSEAASILVAICDTYLYNPAIDIADYVVATIDHQGNELPLDIERKCND